MQNHSVKISDKHSKDLFEAEPCKVRQSFTEISATQFTGPAEHGGLGGGGA